MNNQCASKKIKPAQNIPVADGPGIPSRAPGLDVLPGFKNPPPGYGEVPFWWWTGDILDENRLISQIQALHEKGISGVQVNYSHLDTPGWATDLDTPAIFSDEWWEVYSHVSAACTKLDMGIGMSTYTIDWPKGAHNLFYHLFYKKAELNAFQLAFETRQPVSGKQSLSLDCAPDQFAARAYPVLNGTLQRGGIDLTPLIKNGKLNWLAPAGDWEVWTFRAVRVAGTLNPLMANSGETVIRGFFQQFQDHNPGKSAKGLNYFFNDELTVGVDKLAWNPDFAAEFQQRKGYDLFEVLPAMWQDMGNITPKVRLDYADVRMALMEERYFMPIFKWHASRGLIFACDSGGRGTEPNEFGDYFRATRWYSAPGHDTPGGKADLIKGKVSSSVANLYQRPRVWLEGYHSLGWGAAPELLMQATRENYLFGCTLLNLHGLYYSTFGSHWEWAPPCYHFRMPYWAHMGTFLRYFDRLSYLLSQGHFVCDVAVVYPVAPYEAEMDGEKSKDTAFEMAYRLMANGINFEFVDNDSLARAVVENGRLTIKDAGSSYQALVFPDMKAVRWPSIEKAASFAQAGGHVYVVGALPTASDHAGCNDPELHSLNERAFKPACRFNQTAEVVEAIRSAFIQDVHGIDQTVRTLHRKVGNREVYLVMDARKNSVVEFRAKGAVELWDPWMGATRPLRVVSETATGTQVELPLEDYEAHVVVFTPGKKHNQPAPAENGSRTRKMLPTEWTVAFEPTMDNTYGDFRLPITDGNRMIGPEGRRFAWAQENETLAQTAMQAETDDRNWERKLHGYGTQFYLLGPVPTEVDVMQLDRELAGMKTVDPAVPVTMAGKTLKWQAYDFSWRYGKEDHPGHQGHHGLKRTITDDFICLGKPDKVAQSWECTEPRFVEDAGGTRYYLWTCATVKQPTKAALLVSPNAPAAPDNSHSSPVVTPAAVFVNGSPVKDFAQGVHLHAGSNPVLVRYEQAGRSHFVIRRMDEPTPTSRQPLAMRWYNDTGVIPFDVTAGRQPAEWFRFCSAPGTKAIGVKARGKIAAWLDGKPMLDEGQGRFVASHSALHAAVVALRIIPETGMTGGAAIPEPIVVETDGKGLMTLGDWSQTGILNNYSGGVRYQTSLTLTAGEANARSSIDLGQVAATAEVHINGELAGIRVAPPWRLDITGLLKEGTNTIEVLVYNTLANHFQTIPSRFRGNPVSGLIGPVAIEFTA